MELLDAKDAARFCRLTRSFMSKLRMTAHGPAFIKAGSKVLYEKAILEEWLRARTRRSTSDNKDSRTQRFDRHAL